MGAGYARSPEREDRWRGWRVKNAATSLQLGAPRAIDGGRMNVAADPLRVVSLSWLGWIKGPMVAFSSGMLLLNLLTASDTAFGTLGNQVYALVSFVWDYPDSTLSPKVRDSYRWLWAIGRPAFTFLIFAAIIVVLRRACELRPFYGGAMMGIALAIAGVTLRKELIPSEMIPPLGVEGYAIGLFLGVLSWLGPFICFFAVSLAVLGSRWQRIISAQPWSVAWTLYGTARARARHLGLGLRAVAKTIVLFSVKLLAIFVAEYFVEDVLDGMIESEKSREAGRSLFWAGLVLVIASYDLVKRRGFRGVAGVVAAGAINNILWIWFLAYFMYGDDPRPLSDIRAETSGTAGFGLANAFDWIAMVLLLRSWVVGRSLRPIEEWLKRMRLDAQEMMMATSKQPILFLRSFRDDDRWTWGSFGVARWVSGRLDARVRIEEVVAQAAVPRGPLIALSNPSDGLERLGAARAHVSDEGWRDYVKQRMGDCRIIVCFLGSTENFRWEVQEILASDIVHKLIVVMPPSYPNDRTITQTLPELAHLMGLDSVADETARLCDAKVIVCSQSAGGFIAIKSRWNKSSPTWTAYASPSD
jgi:hypothetical protein